MPLTVAQFNDQFFARAQLGLARYGRELYYHIKRESDLRLRPIGAWSNMEKPDLKEWCTRTGGRVLPGRRKLWAMGWHLLRRPYLEHVFGAFDLLHFTAPGYVVPTKRPVLATIHDIGLVTHPHFFSKSYRFLFMGHMRDLIRRQAGIISVSRHSADEFRRHVSRELDIEVIYEGPAKAFHVEPTEEELQAARDAFQLTRPFLLSVGSFNPRKNLNRLITAFSGLIDEIPHDLVLVGASGWDDDDVWQALKTPALEGRVRFLGFVGDRELNTLYRSADAFCFVSIFEGFGLPAVEAMAGGCPVVASSTTSLGEVVGDGGLLVEPTDTTAIRDALRKVATDSALRDDLSARGLQRSRSFSWQKAACETVQLYHDIADRKTP